MREEPSAYGSKGDGNVMQIWACTPGQGDAAQHYTITSTNRIQWSGKNECLDLTDGSLQSGNRVCFVLLYRVVSLVLIVFLLSQIQVWACAAGNTNQVWNIV